MLVLEECGACEEVEFCEERFREGKGGRVVLDLGGGGGGRGEDVDFEDCGWGGVESGGEVGVGFVEGGRGAGG